MGARETIQARIAAQERYDAIEYGIRGYKARKRWRGYCGNATRTAARWEAEIRAAAGQIDRAHDAGDTVLGENGTGGTEWGLRRAKKIAAEALRAARDAEKAIGTKRQLRLALAA